MAPRLVLLIALAVAVAFAAPAAAADAAAAAPQQRILDSSTFPSERPPLWKFRTLRDARSVTCSVNANNMLSAKIEHLPLSNVTAQQLLWLWRNMDNGASVRERGRTTQGPQGEGEEKRERLGSYLSAFCACVVCLLAALCVQMQKCAEETHTTPPKKTHKRTNTQTHPVNGRRYANFLLMHPRDHVSVQYSLSSTPPGSSAPAAPPRPIAPRGDAVSVRTVEMPLAGCRERPDATDAADRWSCPGAPAANPGATRATSPAVWRALSQVNGTGIVRELSLKRFSTAVKGCNDNGACAKIIRTTHSL